MGHAYNHGLVTSMKGAAIESARITGMNTANCTIAEQCAAGVIKSVAIAAGVVTVTLNGPYPPKLVTVLPSYSVASPSGAYIFARYIHGSYNATAGTFRVAVSSTPATPAAASPAAADELHLVMIFKRYTGLSS